MKKSNGGMNLYKKPFIKNKLFSYAAITQQSLPKGLPAKHTTPGQNIQHPCPAGCPASTASPPCHFMVLWEAGPQLPPVPCSHTGSQSWSRSPVLAALRPKLGTRWAPPWQKESQDLSRGTQSGQDRRGPLRLVTEQFETIKDSHFHFRSGSDLKCRTALNLSRCARTARHM